MIRGFTNQFRLLTKICFMYNQPPRNPTLPTEATTMMPYSINFLRDNKGAIRKPKQVGRGPGSGKGKTAGKGHKGQLARQGGKVHVRFEGGQTPITRRLPKYGRVFKTRKPQDFNIVNMWQIDYFVKRKIIDPSQPITIKTLVDVGLAKKIKYGVKILAKIIFKGVERIDYPLHFQVSDMSKNVIEKIKQLGGSVRLIHRTPLKLKEHIKPEKFPLPLAEPITPWWKVRKLMRKQQDRGVQIEYTKPKWMSEVPVDAIIKPASFQYPFPRNPNPQKIRKRRVKLFKKFDFGV